MQNLTTTHLPEIRDENRIFVPAGNGKTNFIDVRDIGEAIAQLLLDDAFLNRAFTLTGEVSYTYGEVAELMTSILGTKIKYHDAHPLAFLRYHRKSGKKLKHRLVMLALYSVTRFGKAGAATGALRNLLGRKPNTLEQFIKDHRDILLGKTAHEE
jgi:nucleoside-diphosphate-sugar epimerase